MLIVDLFCGEGGAAMGYHLAGFDVIGVDAEPQPRYPFPFVRADCLDKAHRIFQLADAIHASPPCQFGTELNSQKWRHQNLIPATRKMLQASGKPYVIENVRAVREHLIDPISLFGTMFNNHMITSQGQRFDLSRERLFETNWGLTPPANRVAHFPIANVFGGHLRARSGEFRTGGSTGRTRDFIGEDKPAMARRLMEMPWATMGGMSEAVPPAYTDFVGRRLEAYLRERYD